MRNTWVNRCRKSSYKNLTLIRDKNCQHTRMKGASSSWWRAAAHVLWLTAYPTERDGTVPPQDQGEAAFPTSAPRCTGGSSLGVRQGEKLKCIKIGKSKTVPVWGWCHCLQEKPRGIYKTTIWTNKWSKTAGWKINVQKFIVFLKTSNRQLGNVISF